MSRSGFSIRKLIINPRRSWDSDDDSSEETFECSSAKTLRIQHELEQYQSQQIQKAARHPRQHHSSQWMRSHSPAPSKSTTTFKKTPRPITIVRSSSGAVLTTARTLNPTGRRNSTPHTTTTASSSSSPSLVATHNSPALPLSARTLGDAPCAFCGGDRSQRQHRCQQTGVLQTAVRSVLTPSPSPQLLASSPSDWDSPMAGPSPASLSRKASYEQPASHVSTMWLASSGSRSGGHTTRSYSFSSPHKQQQQQQQYHLQHQSASSALLHSHNTAVKTPTIIRTFADVTLDSNTGAAIVAMSGPSPQHSTFVNGVPSPPLDPQDVHSGQFGGSVLSLKTVPSVGQLSTASESTWYLESEREDNTPLLDNMEQLIRETDEAFKAVNSALDEVKLVSRCPTPPVEVQHKSNTLQQAEQALQTQARRSRVHSRRPDPIAIMRDAPQQHQLTSPISPLTKTGRGSLLSPRKSKSASPLTSTAQILRSPTRGTSVSKARRGSKSSPKAKVQQRSASYDMSPPARKLAPSSPPTKAGSLTRHQHHSYHRSFSRLNFAADKVTDRLFEGRGGRFGFQKIEADEIITAEQIEELMNIRRAKAQAETEAEIKAEAKRKVSIGSLRNRASSVIGEQYKGDPVVDGSPRANGARSDSNPLPYVADVATPKASDFQKGFMDLPLTSNGGGKVGQQGLLATPPHTPPQLPQATFSSTLSPQAPRSDKDELVAGTPVRSGRRPSHSRSNSSLSHIPPLPTIPEVRITAPQVDEIIRQSQQPNSSGANKRPEEQYATATSTERTSSPFFEDVGEHIFFESSPYTVTQPAFRHGRICLAKADLVNAGTINSLESKLLTSPDETMDWIAFQMAILGGAGDLFYDPNDFLSRDAQEDLADDLCDWLEDMGFSNDLLGSLEKEPKKPAQTQSRVALSQPQAQIQSQSSPETNTSSNTSTPESLRQSFRSQRNASVDSRSSSPDSRSSDEIPDSEVSDVVAQFHNLPIPITSEHPSGYWNTQPPDASRLRKASVSADRGIKRWTLEGQRPKRYQGPGIDVSKANGSDVSAGVMVSSKVGGGNKLLHPHAPRTPKSGRLGAAATGSLLRESMVSLPQSPMLDLVMTTAVDGSKEFVPMGYNLGHDLGDFLKWESEHVYASGFYGSD